MFSESWYICSSMQMKLIAQDDQITELTSKIEAVTDEMAKVSEMEHSPWSCLLYFVCKIDCIIGIRNHGFTN